MSFRIIQLVMSLCFLLLFTNANAQFGIRAGINVSDQQFESQFLKDYASPIIGVNLAVSKEFVLTNWLSLQPELHFTQKGRETEFYSFGGRMNIRSTLNYLELGLMGKVNVWNVNDVTGIYLGISPHLGYGVGGRVKLKNSLYSSTETVKITFGEDYKRWDLGIGVGGGLEWRNFILDIRYVHGFTDITTGGSNYMKNRAWLFGIGYGFNSRKFGK